MQSDDREFQEHDEKVVDQKVTELLRFFDAAQIFVTRQEPDGRTMAYSAGRGNFYSRWGLIHEWCAQGANISESPLEEEPEEGDGEPPTQEP